MVHKLQLAIVTVAAMTIALAGAPAAHAQFSNQYVLGVNWMQFNPLYQANFDSIFNLYQGGASLMGDDSAAIATMNAASSVMYIQYGNDTNWSQSVQSYVDAIHTYSCAQRLQYFAAPLPATNSPSWFQNYYFWYRDQNTGQGDTIKDSVYWQINKNLSGPPFDSDKALYGNQFCRSFQYYEPQGPFRLGIKFQVANTAGSSPYRDSAIVKVILRAQCDTADVDSAVPYDKNVYLGASYELSIPWDSVATANQDYYFISKYAFTIPFDTISYNPTVYRNPLWENCRNDIHDTAGPGLLLEVWTNRYETIKISYVVLEDSNAADLLTNQDYNNLNLNWKARFDSVQSWIWQDSTFLSKQANGKMSAFYMGDEPMVGEFQPQHEMLTLLGGHANTEETEGGWGAWSGNPTDYPAFCAQVQPTNLIAGEEYINGGYYNPYMDSAAFGIQGYFPSSGYQTNRDSAYAMSKNYNQTSSDTSFDPYDFHVLVNEDFWNLARISNLDNVIYINPTAYGITNTTGWWANFWFQKGYKFDSDGNISMAQPNAGAPVATEYLSFNNNLNLALGVKGFLYFAGVSLFTDSSWDNGNVINFIGMKGNHNSDWDTMSYKKVYAPDMQKSNFEYMYNFSQWLKNYGTIFNSVKWLGGYIRDGNDQQMGNYPPNYIWCQHFLLGQNPILDTTYILETRPMLLNWNSNAVIQDTLPDSLRWYIAGFFQDTTNQIYYAYFCNPWKDGRDIHCRQVTYDSIVPRRGERFMYFRMHLDSSKSQYFKLITEDTSQADTVIAYDGIYRIDLLPGAGKLVKIIPFCDFAERNPIDSNGVSTNSGTHCVKHSDGGYRTVYVRGDSVFERKMTDCGVREEQCVEPGGDTNNFANYPTSCPNIFNSTLQLRTLSFLHCKCVNPVIAQHRGQDADEDLIVWEEDTKITQVSTENTSYFSNIIASAWSYASDMPVATPNDSMGRMLIADWSILLQDSTFRPAPVVCGNDSGYIIAWADSGVGIRVCALQGSNGNYKYSDNVLTVNSPNNMQPAMYPSIAWGTDNIPSNSWFVPTAHLVWQQQNSIGSNQIWHGNCYYRTVNNY